MTVPRSTKLWYVLDGRSLVRGVDYRDSMCSFLSLFLFRVHDDNQWWQVTINHGIFLQG